MIRIRDIDHVVFRVRDVARAIAFYLRDPDGNTIELKGSPA
jgi:catechol 2,3-dioxygenase-like lactoylglutathione lyase family enzyme